MIFRIKSKLDVWMAKRRNRYLINLVEGFYQDIVFYDNNFKVNDLKKDRLLEITYTIRAILELDPKQRAKMLRFLLGGGNVKKNRAERRKEKSSPIKIVKG